jgi:hypothetical protein
MESPKPSEHHKKLEPFVGRWTAKERVFASAWSPKDSTADAAFDFRFAADGFALVGDYTHDEPAGGMLLRGDAVIGWDDKQKHYFLFWLDNYGSSNITGRWEGDALMFEGGSQRTSFRLRKTGFISRVEMREGPEWKTLQEGTFAGR